MAARHKLFTNCRSRISAVGRISLPNITLFCMYLCAKSFK